MEHIFKKRKQRLALFETFRNLETKPKIHCKSCDELLDMKELNNNYGVCKSCGYHFPISAYDRIKLLIDTGSFKELYSRLKQSGNMDFPEYKEKLEKARKSTGLEDAVVCGTGKIAGHKVCIAVMDSKFMMASMGALVGEKLTRLIEYATKKKRPLIIVSASGGARMQEGLHSLMQMAKTVAALGHHNDAKLLYISVLTHPTTGGVSASFALLGDINISEPKALIGFAGKRVIEKTIQETLPVDFQTSEFMQDKGFLDSIVERSDMKEYISKILKIHDGGRV